jgi:hypothetical protein
MPKPPTKSALATQVALELDGYLKKWEADPKINKPLKGRHSGLKQFWNAGCWRVGTRLHVVYVAYQGVSTIDFEVAVKWLEWLKQGNVGSHHEYAQKFPRVKDENLVLFPDKDYRPGLRDPLGPETFMDEDADVYAPIVTAYFEMMEAFAPKVTPDKSERYSTGVIPHGTHPIGTFPTYHQLTPEQQTKANAMFVAISATIKVAYTRGLNHGRDLLTQMARGEVSPQDFDSGSAKASSKRKRKSSRHHDEDED